MTHTPPGTRGSADTLKCTGRVPRHRYSQSDDGAVIAESQPDTTACRTAVSADAASVLHDRDWLEARLNAGESVTAIARTCGVSRQAVQQWIRRHGLTHTPPPPIRHHRRPQPPELDRLYRERGSITAVAEHLHVNPATVGRWCREAGITLNDRGRPPLDLPVDIWRRQRDQGWTITQIAKTAGVSPTTVRRHLQNAGTNC